MELIVFIGIQGSGKSTFYKERFADTHVRINLDMLNTRGKEEALFRACLMAKIPMAVDNTNPTAEERARYIVPAREAGFAVTGYYFQSKIEDCKGRNSKRSEKDAVPLRGLLGTYARLKRPALTEGFARLWYVSTNPDGTFKTEEWSDEV